MKKIFIKSANLFIIGLLAVTLSGCFGTFAITRKVYEMNDSINSPIVKNVVFWVFIILPVYEIAAFLDAVIFNLIEFWTGTNPIAMEEGDCEMQTVSVNGTVYEMTATKNQMHVKAIEGIYKGQEVTMIYEPETQAWYAEGCGERVKLAEPSCEDGDSMQVYHPNGTFLKRI